LRQVIVPEMRWLIHERSPSAWRLPRTCFRAGFVSARSAGYALTFAVVACYPR
jgi:hypothetical protein